MGDSQHKARAHLNKNVVRVYRATCFRQVTLLRSACNELTVLWMVICIQKIYEDKRKNGNAESRSISVVGQVPLLDHTHTRGTGQCRSKVTFERRKRVSWVTWEIISIIEGVSLRHTHTKDKAYPFIFRFPFLCLHISWCTSLKFPDEDTFLVKGLFHVAQSFETLWNRHFIDCWRVRLGGVVCCSVLQCSAEQQQWRIAWEKRVRKTDTTSQKWCETTWFG